MDKNVQISITGIQDDGKQTGEITSNLTGLYYLKNNKHYIMYEEYMDDGNAESVTSNTLTISYDSLRGYHRVDLIKKGCQHSHLSFALGEKYAGSYNTPYGTFLMVVDTTAMDIAISGKEIKLDIEYELYINDEYISHNRILINIH